MTILRCAWHQPRKKWLKVAWWGGWSIQFSDGICAACKAKVFEEMRKGDR